MGRLRPLFTTPGSRLKRTAGSLSSGSAKRVSSMRAFAGTTPGSRLLLMGLVSVLAGILVAGIALPVVGTFGLAAKASTQAFEELDGDLPQVTLEEKSVLLANDGTPLATYYSTNRDIIPLAEMGEWGPKSVVAIEDFRFFDHGGIDLTGTTRALIATQSGKEVQGGSTLTQQYVKNVLIEDALSRDDTEAAEAARTQKRGVEGYARKLRELRYAAQVEDRLPKEKILENYLNIAYFGNGAYGIESAAQRYFSKPAKELQKHEAALLAGLVQNPSEHDPVKRPDGAKVRRDTVLNRMAETGAISFEDAAAARKLPLGLNVSKEQSGCEAVQAAAFFCDYVRRLISDDARFGATPEDRRDLLFRGGLTIKSTLDPQKQAAAHNAVTTKVFAEDPVVATTVTVEPGTGAILAMANSRGFGLGPNEIKFNPAADRAMGASNGIQPGSTFKTFTAAVALEQGFGLDHSINSPATVNGNGVERCPGFGPVSTYTAPEGYFPENESKKGGTYDMRGGLERSVNTYFIQLQRQLDGGICPIAKLAEKVGLRRAIDGRPLEQFLSFTLGENVVSPVAMAAAYATFPARGKFCPPVALTGILDRNGQPISFPQPSCEQVLRPEVADAVNSMTKGVVEQGTARRAKLDDGRDQGGKTGTHQRLAVWYAGYTPNLSTMVAVYNPFEPFRRLEGFKIGGETGPSNRWAGGTLAAPIWKLATDEMVKDGVPAEKFVPVTEELEKGTRGGGAQGAVDDTEPREGEAAARREGDNAERTPPESPSAEATSRPTSEATGTRSGGGNGQSRNRDANANAIPDGDED